MAELENIKLTDCAVPLAFEERYFVLEPGAGNLFNVVLKHEGKPLFEIRQNEPAENPITEIKKLETGIITVSEKETEKFLYKYKPGPETIFVFGKNNGGKITVIINIPGKTVNVGGITLDGCSFNDLIAGVWVNDGGTFEIGASIPRVLRRLFKK